MMMWIKFLLNFIKRWLFEVEIIHEEDPGRYWKERFYRIDEDGNRYCAWGDKEELGVYTNPKSQAYGKVVNLEGKQDEGG